MKCKDCDNEADPQYTMDFTDVKPGAYIYWCKACGPLMHEINQTLQDKMSNEEGFTERFAAAMDEVESRKREELH